MKSRNIVAVLALAVLALAAAIFPEFMPLAYAHADSGSLMAGLAGAPFLLGDTELLKKALADLETGVTRTAADVAAYNAKVSEWTRETKARLLALEQRGARPAPISGSGDMSPGRIVAESPEFKALRPSDRNLPAVQIGSFKTAIVNATGLNQPLVPADRQGMVPAADMQTLAVRSLFAPATTQSNMIEFPRDLSTDSDIEASPQYSSPAFENVPKKESAMSFELANAPVVTVAHWIPASRQVLSDSSMLASYIDGRLIYGVKLNEEEQILNGDGTGGNLTGLITEAASYSGAVSGDTAMDTLIRAVAQVNGVGIYTASGIVLNPADITALLLLKDGQQRYMFDSVAAIESKLQVRIASSKQQAAGTFLAGDFLRGAQLFDREDATVRVAEQHADFFVKNMVAVLGEERLALAVYNGTAFVTGSF